MTSTERRRADARACHAAALAAVDAARLTASSLSYDGNGSLTLGLVAGAPSRVHHGGPVLLVGAGKAALAMAGAVRETLGGGCRGGLVIVPHREHPQSLDVIEVASGAHPIPDAAGAAATARLLALAGSADRRTLVVAVLSGGASALLVAPALGLTLADKQGVTAELLAAGADITALNTVRKHCSQVKGGGLARVAAGAAGLWALVLSDVVGDDPATIASGPTVADPTRFADAEAALARYLDAGAIPAAVRDHLARGRAGAIPETPKPGDPALARAHTVVVGGNRDAVRAAAAEATARGYTTETLDEPLTGDATAAGERLAARLLAAPRDRPVAIVGGGETTVRVVPGGRGGRAQQLALAAACALAGMPAVVLAAGTDGVDGPTDAAGACVDGETVARARGRSLDPRHALLVTDSYPLLDACGDLLRTGPSGTNVADVVVALRSPC